MVENKKKVVYHWKIIGFTCEESYNIVIITGFTNYLCKSLQNILLCMREQDPTR